MKNGPKSIQCQVCKEDFSPHHALQGRLVRLPIAEVIRRSNPDWSEDSYICHKDLNNFRGDYIKELLESERGELAELDHEVLRSLQEHETLSTNTNLEFDQPLTFGERLSDRLAEFGGSWKFIILFAVILVGWLIVNSIFMKADAFDPYPFILLNLVLPCLAAIQAPAILMSDNREEAKDRLRAEHDYRVNLKAELEIRLLSEKLDHLLRQQWKRLDEIQQVQIVLLVGADKES